MHWFIEEDVLNKSNKFKGCLFEGAFREEVKIKFEFNFSITVHYDTKRLGLKLPRWIEIFNVNTLFQNQHQYPALQKSKVLYHHEWLFSWWLSLQRWMANRWHICQKSFQTLHQYFVNIVKKYKNRLMKEKKIIDIIEMLWFIFPKIQLKHKHNHYGKSWKYKINYW